METDVTLIRARELFAKSEMTLEQLGQAMGYPLESARKSAWQFLNKTADPRLSMIRKFAAAIGVTLQELVTDPEMEPKQNRREKKSKPH
jgi:transcriptional regulator with XRE-family HTH domain